MRIYWYWPWPAERAVGLANGTAQVDDELLVHALRGPSPIGLGEGVEVVATLPTPSRRREWSPRWFGDRSMMLVRRATARAGAVRRGDFDICHVHLPNYLVDPVALRLLARRAPLVTSVHDVLPHHTRVPRPLERALHAAMYRALDHVVVYHDYLRDRLEAEFGVDPARITVIPHPVRLGEHRTRPDTAADVPTVLFFGALRRNKGLPDLLAALDHIDGSFRLVVAGRGAAELEAAVQARAEVDDRVHARIGFVPIEERTRIYDEADLVVLPYTEFESQSGVLADAYASGVPVVGTDVGALGSTIQEDRSGWVAPAHDPPALGRVITAALADHHRRHEISASLADVVDARSEAATGRAFRRVYEEVLATGPQVPAR